MDMVLTSDIWEPPLILNPICLCVVWGMFCMISCLSKVLPHSLFTWGIALLFEHYWKYSFQSYSLCRHMLFVSLVNIFIIVPSTHLPWMNLKVCCATLPFLGYSLVIATPSQESYHFALFLCVESLLSPLPLSLIAYQLKLFFQYTRWLLFQKEDSWVRARALR